MNRSEIAIQVSTKTLDGYLHVLRTNNEPIGDVDITSKYTYLVYINCEWVVYVHMGRKRVDWTPSNLEDFLIGKRAAERASKPMVITFDIGDKKVTFDGRLVHHTTRHGVEMTSKIPEDWATTRVCQFMDSLIKADFT